MARRRTIKEPESTGRVTVKDARNTADRYRSASTGRFVTKGHARKKSRG